MNRILIDFLVVLIASLMGVGLVLACIFGVVHAFGLGPRGLEILFILTGLATLGGLVWSGRKLKEGSDPDEIHILDSIIFLLSDKWGLLGWKVLRIGIVIGTVGIISVLGLIGGNRPQQPSRPEPSFNLIGDRLRALTAPNEATHRFIHSVDPTETNLAGVRLARCFHTLNQRYVYQPPPQGKKQPIPPDQFLNKFEGDSADFSITVAAISRTLGFRTRVCGGVSHKDPEVHQVWAEIQISSSTSDLSPNVSNQLKQLFGSSSTIVKKRDGWWLQAIPPSTIKRYKEIWSTDLHSLQSFTQSG